MTTYIVIDVNPLISLMKSKGIPVDTLAPVAAKYLGDRYCLPTGYDRRMPAVLNMIPEQYVIPYLEGNVETLLDSGIDPDTVIWVELQDDLLVISR